MTINNGQEFVLYCGRKIDPDFNLKGELLENYKIIYTYLFQHDKCKEIGIDPKKGLYLYGLKGSGKSLALRVMNRMIIDSKLDMSNRFMIKTMKQLEREYENIRGELFDIYGQGYKKPIAFDESFLDMSLTGSKYAGKKIDIHAELLSDRHLLFIEEGIKTHLTSNLNIKILADEKLLDERVIERIEQSFNEIYWKGASLR